MNDLGQYQNLTFTTEPKTRRHLTRGAFISGNRAAEFMQHLWKVGLKKSSRYEVLEYEFIHFFGTNDKRTVERYIGRPKQAIRSAGSTSIVRQNLQSGKIAQFNYFNVRNVPAKKGLLEDLEYIKRIEENGQTRFLLNHERMSYYTEQTTLETANVPQESEESSESSNDNMCVSPLLEEKSKSILSCGERVGGKTAPEVVPQIEAKEKEEEAIDSTHTNQSSESEKRQLCPDMLALLKVKIAGSVPDKTQLSRSVLQ